MSGLERVVKAIYEESGDIAAFGVRDTTLPPEWDRFFRKRAQGLRNQQPEPEVELVQILEEIAKTLDEHDKRLTALEELSEIEEEVEEIAEEVETEGIRKSTTEIQSGLALAALKGQLAGISGEFVERRGFGNA